MRRVFTALAPVAAALWMSAASASGPDITALLEGDDPALQTQWGLRYEHAEGVERDIDRALRLYCAAARQGHAEAQYRLGWMYANGRGVERDDPLAAAWFDLAAEQGDPHAARMLRFVENPEPVREPTCILSDGSVAPERLESVADPSRELVATWVQHLSPEYGLDARFVLAVIEAESAFNPRARSPKNALGLMQLLPATAARFGVRDVWDPLENLRGGMAYLRWLLDRFEGDVERALAGYNAGEKAVLRYGGIPPYPETRSYVKTITHALKSRGSPVQISTKTF